VVRRHLLVAAPDAIRRHRLANIPDNVIDAYRTFVDWDQAAQRWLEPAIKMVITR
jgi:hypothetical protein